MAEFDPVMVLTELRASAADLDRGLVTILAGLLAIVVFILIGRLARSRSPTDAPGGSLAKESILIVGVSGEDDAASAGKTTLFKVLKNGSPPKHGVVSSQVPNAGAFAIHETLTETKDVYHIIDYPGHTRLTRPLLKQYLPRARAVIFVVDGVRFASSAARDGVLLHAVMKSNINAAPILVFINKGDVATCVGVTAVRTRLTAEVDSCARQGGRVMNLAGADDADEEDADDRLWGPGPGETFTFAAHAGCAVSFARGSALGGDVAAAVQLITT